MFKTLLLTSAIVYLAMAACNTDTRLFNIQSGSISIPSNSRNNQPVDTIYQQSFEHTFDQIPQVIYAFQGFFLMNNNISEWHFFTDQITTSKLTFAFHHSGSDWNSVQVGFWASARPDIELGSIAENVDTSIQKTYSFTRKMNSENKNDNKTVIRTFLHGYEGESTNQFELRYLHQVIDDSTVMFSFQAGAMTINKIYLNYIVFNSQKSGFHSYGGSVSEQDFETTKVYNFQQTLYKSPYSMFGLISSKFEPSVNFRFNPALSEDFYFRVDATKQITEFTFTFIAIGVAPNANCGNCAEKYMSGDECVASCSLSQYEVNYSDGGKGCRSCPNKYGYVIAQSRQGCTCSQGLVFGKYGFCVPPTTQTTTVTTTSNQATGSSGSSGQNNTQSNSNSQASTVDFSNSFSDFSATNQQANQGFSPATNNQQANQGFSPATNNQQPNQGSSAQSNSNQIFSPQASFYQAPPVKDCSSQINTFFNGVQCVCRVGYKKVNGFCVNAPLIGGNDIYYPPEFIYDLAAYHKDRPVTCQGENQIYDGQLCVCRPGFRRVSGECVQIQTNCTDNSRFVNQRCVCNPGYMNVSGLCVPEVNCQDNAYYNGVQCVCKQGYRMINGRCINGTICPPYSEFENNQCVCIDGYQRYNGTCARCPDGLYYYAETRQCIVICGVNQEADSGKNCVCKPGFGKYEGKCSICPNNFFLFNGYCVRCPFGAIYNLQTKKCECDNNFVFNEGFCKNLCSNSQVFVNGQCRCPEGYGYGTNGFCQTCPSGSIDSITGKCNVGCNADQVLLNSKCYCKAGLGYYGGKCIQCSTVNGFQIDGQCAICPSGQIIVNNKCQCPPGQQLKNGRCLDLCKPGQLVDAQGYCYECPLIEIPVNGRCECRNGYQRVNGVCTLNCNYHIIPGTYRCAKCIEPYVFNDQLKACVCKDGFYVDANGRCVPYKVPPIQCQKGKYYSPSQGCLNCPLKCSECKNATNCIVCSEFGFKPNKGVCQPICGDGHQVGGQQCDDGNLLPGDGCSATCKTENFGPICGDGFIRGTEKCDDKNNIADDGCTQCVVDPGYRCQGEPSKCTQKPTPKGLQYIQPILYNMVNIFVTLQTDRPFYFPNQSQMRSFIKYRFPNESVTPGQVYCLQEPSSPTNFRCLFNYLTTKMPSQAFQVQFSYNYQGYSGSVTVPIDPTKSVFNSRSLK